MNVEIAASCAVTAATVPAEDYACDTSGTGYPQLAVSNCEAEFNAAIACVSDNT